MTLRNGDRFTVYDAMAASGYFDSNPANAGARDKDGRSLYSGPVKFPMMLYHPRGEEEIIIQGTMEKTAWGTVEKFNEQWDLIHKVVSSEEELAEALAEGWHKHPAFAIKVANETWRKEQGLKPLPVPPISAGSRIADLEEQNKKLTEMLEEARRNKEEMEGDAKAAGVGFVPPSRSASPVAKAGLV